MKWLGYLLGLVMAKFLPSTSRENGSPSSQIKTGERHPWMQARGSMQDRTTSNLASESLQSPLMSNIEEQFMDGFFNQKDLDLSVEEFSSALKGLLKAKIIREVEHNGQTMYQLTPLGRAIAQHRFHTNPKEQN